MLFLFVSFQCFCSSSTAATTSTKSPAEGASSERHSSCGSMLKELDIALGSETPCLFPSGEAPKTLWWHLRDHRTVQMMCALTMLFIAAFLSLAYSALHVVKMTSAVHKDVPVRAIMSDPNTDCEELIIEDFSINGRCPTGNDFHL